MLDSPQTPRDRMQMYADALRFAHDRGEPQCKGQLTIRNDPNEDWVYLHCAVGIIVRDVLGADVSDPMTTCPNEVSLVMQDLVYMGFDQNYLFRLNDREEKTFGQIADAFRSTLETIDA